MLANTFAAPFTQQADRNRYLSYPYAIAPCLLARRRTLAAGGRANRDGSLAQATPDSQGRKAFFDRKVRGEIGRASAFRRWRRTNRMLCRNVITTPLADV